MSTYPAGIAVTLNVLLVDFNGDPVEPTGLAFEVRDLAESVIVPRTPITPFAGLSEAQITVPAAQNALPAGAVSGGRIVRVFITSAGGENVRDAVYGLRSPRRLVPPQNTFQTDAAALVLADDLPGAAALSMASDADRQAALIEAHARITRLPLRVLPQRGPREWTLDRHAWAEMSAAAFQALPAALLSALARAQAYEATKILDGDPIGEKRRAGIISERIGESSVTFATAQDAASPLASAAALAELVPYRVPERHYVEMTW